jgi:hypothetical protein
MKGPAPRFACVNLVAAPGHFFLEMEPQEPGTRVFCRGKMTHPETRWGRDTWAAEEYAFCGTLHPAESQRNAQLRHCVVQNVPLPLGHVRPVGQWQAPHASPMDSHHWGQYSDKEGTHDQVVWDGTPKRTCWAAELAPGFRVYFLASGQMLRTAVLSRKVEIWDDRCQHCGNIDDQAVLCENCSHVCCPRCFERDPHAELALVNETDYYCPACRGDCHADGSRRACPESCDGCLLELETAQQRGTALELHRQGRWVPATVTAVALPYVTVVGERAVQVRLTLANYLVEMGPATLGGCTGWRLAFT